MKKLIKVAVASVVSVTAVAASASVLGILVNSEFGSSVTGRSVYRCVYDVLGQRTVVTSEEYCPATMEFD